MTDEIDVSRLQKELESRDIVYRPRRLTGDDVWARNLRETIRIFEQAELHKLLSREDVQDILYLHEKNLYSGFDYRGSGLQSILRRYHSKLPNGLADQIMTKYIRMTYELDGW